MKLTIAAIGRIKAGPMAELVDTYAKRTRQAGRHAGITTLNVVDFPESRKSTSAARAGEEAELLANAAPSGSVLIVLDERGKPVSTADFAGIIRKELDSGTQDLVFAIGGPDGHAPEIRKKARYMVSFGHMTWPHMLARVLLAEQIYRVVTILVNHPYHRN
ncbi:MAG: 23S rRNA (pseudouridine(1915)-N(3))-methyltransferase RlmH [Anderseniella sp.]